MGNYVPFVIYMAICIVAIALAVSHKARCLFAAVILCAVVFVGVFALHGAARADEISVEVTGVAPVVIDGELGLEVFFEYDGQILSWFEVPEEDVFDTTCLYHVVVGNNFEVFDATKEMK